MRRIKTICIFAGLGFLISFIFGLFSGRGIGFVLLRALIFAAIFALFGLGISFLYEKFLDDESSEMSSEPINVNSNNGKESVQKGQMIDVTIQDEDLPQGNSSNHFVVNENHQMLNKNDTVQTVQEPTEEAVEAKPVEPENNGFVPLKNFETVNTFSSTEAVAKDVISGAKAAARPSSVDGELDVLPDLENMEFGSKAEVVSDSPVVGYEDSMTEFGGSSAGRKTLEDVGIQDAALMAKAISSALSNDEE